ncbi:MAG: exodeoxyribonuclease I [Pseudomonadales bacterium]|nr:exodeoxyribonuclease I [Pseudomonadales bacterium]
MSFYWYDFETFGADPFRDRPAQFAGIRTDDNFNPVGDPLVIYCKPANDMLPQPEACLITGITPQLAAREGVCEAEFIRQIHMEFSQPNTCVVGYNSIRFDDEITRNCLYRNFYDPYAREWQNGNSRWDIIDMVRLTHALRPEGINWPNHEDGRPSFKLEQLTKANNITHEAAHDALSDVWATIALAKLIREKQPKLYDYVYRHRDKRLVDQQLNLQDKKPVLHISSKYPADRGCAAIVAPLARDKVNKNAVYVYDLNIDPQSLLTLGAEQIRERVFTASDQLPAGVNRIPLKAIHVNKCPVVVPANLVTPEVAERLNIDIAGCLENLEKIKQAPDLGAKIADVFDQSYDQVTDPDLMLYSGGFFSNHDKNLMEQLRRLPPQQLVDLRLTSDDQRIPEMLFRYRARNYLETLSEAELAHWEEYRKDRLTQRDGGGSITLKDFFEKITNLRADTKLDSNKLSILDALENYANGLL